MNTARQFLDREMVELELLEACREIGGVSECNCHFTSGLSNRLAYRIGKPVDELTVGELREAIRKHAVYYNQLTAARSA